MTIDEKRDILDRYCGPHGCDNCVLRQKNLWTLNKKDVIDCLPINTSPESDLDKALELIGYKIEPTETNNTPIKDSGDRRGFTSGAVRDMAEGKGR